MHHGLGSGVQAKMNECSLPMKMTIIPLSRPKRRCTIFSLTIFGVLVHSWFGIVDLSFDTLHKQDISNAYQHVVTSNLPLSSHRGRYRISESVKNEYKKWHSIVRKLSHMDRFPANWTLDINWGHHPTSRSKRFPSVEKRIKYYMGSWYNTSVPMYGVQFDRDTYIQRQSTLQYEVFANILVNLYDFKKDRLMDCYQNKEKLQAFSPYCRDYIDIAILRFGGLANIIHFIGDALPAYLPDELMKYPLFAKVRPLCNNGAGSSYINPFCKKNQMAQPIVLPLNRKRHFGVAAEVPSNDIPWEEKKPFAVWRGRYEKTNEIKLGGISGSPDMKYALVSKYLNSSSVDAKFSKHNDGAPVNMVGSYMDIKKQLKYRYIISVEGNDVSSGLKWMLLSNSVVLAPPFTWESWAMEGLLEPFVHYIPINHDLSNVEEMIFWAERHPKESRLIAERSTLFVYDLLFHPDAAKDERLVIEGIMETYENNFGRGHIKSVDESRDLLLSEQLTRAERFPTVEDRVNIYMRNWYDYRHRTLSMKRESIASVQSLVPTAGVSITDPFIAVGDNLALCAIPNSSYSDDIKQLCAGTLPHFDERLTADLKSSSFKRLSTMEIGRTMKFANESSWRMDDKSTKDSNRVLLDNSVKVISLGINSLNDLSIPIFVRWREVSQQSNSIIWPFGLRDAHFTSNSIKQIDVDFSKKHASAIRLRTLNEHEVVTFTERFQNMLKYRYVVVVKDKVCHDTDLMWALFSNSVVLVPQIHCESWLMETKLQPFVHYLPINNDLSNVKEIVEWAEENLDQTLLVSKRSTQYVNDLLYHPDAIQDERLVMERIMDLYRSTIIGKEL